MTSPVQVGPATITINRDDRVLVCQPDGSILGSADDGFFTRDTRFLSGYRLRLNGQSPVLLNAAPIRFFSARFEHTNPALLDRDGPIAGPEPRDPARPHDRGGVHEDLDIVNYARRPVRLNVELELVSDFADIFDVKGGGVVQRGTIDTQWFRSRQELRTVYRNGDFRRELVVAVLAVRRPAQYANGRLRFVAQIEPKGVWHACTSWLPITRSGVGPPAGRAALQRRGDAAPPGRGEPAAGRRAQHLELGRPAGVGPGGRRPRGAAARGPVVRARRRGARGRRPVVRHAVRPRHAHRLDAGDRRLPGVRGRRAAAAGRAPGDRATTRCGTWSRARSRTRSATASSRRRACCRSRPTTAPTTRRRST